MNRVFVLLGSNIDKEKNLPAAVSLLSQSSTISAVSSVFVTTPVGMEDQPLFWNASALIETKLDAFSFRRIVLANVEKSLKRVRTSNRYAPRTIDADITLFNQDVFDLDETHHIPDPDLLKYAHVAVPTAELAPDMKHPETGEPLKKIARRLIAQADTSGRSTLCRVQGVSLIRFMSSDIKSATI